MSFLTKVRDLFGSRPVQCGHLAQITEVAPDSPDSCNACLEMGDTWVNLRVCLVCGRVGCCDNSKNTHATRHFEESGHAVIQSYQPGESWRYCYVDDVNLPAGAPFR